MIELTSVRCVNRLQLVWLFSGWLFGILFFATVGATANVMETKQQRGAYLTRVANCAGCHTARGGAAYAGGRILNTPFGEFVTSNITPDAETGLGRWSEEDFWQALHHGKSKDGRYLYPAFPYTEYTRISRQDADAIFSYLQSVAPVRQINPEHNIHAPYDKQFLLFLWRAWYFKEGVYQPDSTKSQEWNRGAYLVEGLGHCNACHTARNVWGASKDNQPLGGEIIGSRWYAPSLISIQQAGVGHWSIEDIVELLSTGINQHAVTSGPMATIVRQSLQYLTAEDQRAMAVYLKSLGEQDKNPQPKHKIPPMPEVVRQYLARGESIYEKHCQDCHGKFGQGAPGIYPPLAGNRAVMMSSPRNVIRSVLYGGYAPVTAGNPRPYGMPPYQHIIRDIEISQVISYIRNAWGNFGSLVSPDEIDQGRGSEH
ncbi:MAG: cytochrome c [Nitrosomonas sp.]|nr:cytochrome c [Nitrosomonas sp.]